MLFNTIGKKFLTLTTILTVILLGGLGTVLVMSNNAGVRSLMASKGEAMSNYMAKTSTSFYLNFDFSSLEGFVQESVKDTEVKFAIFYDGSRKPVTESVKEPEDISSLLVYEREIKDGDKIIGYLRLGLSQESLIKSLYKGIITVVISIIISLILLVIVISLLIRFVVTKPLFEVKERIKDIATGEGDLTKRLKFNHKDEIGDLAKWFDTFIEKIQNIMAHISQVVSNVVSASQQLSVATDDMSKIISSESENAAHEAVSMDEMSSMIIEVAKNTSDALVSTKHAMEIAESGNKIVTEGMNSTNNIAKVVLESTRIVEKLGLSSQKIGDIVGVIDDIADQTNLLALNAAIEAARAGEQGRGFAVVADEVRKLAERTTKATKEIADMIKAIQKDTEEAVQSMVQGRKEVESGVLLSKRIGDSLQDIIKSVKAVTDMINHIATATEEQAKSSEKASGTMESISAAIKGSLTAIKQSDEVAKNLKGQAVVLQNMIGQFKL